VDLSSPEYYGYYGYSGYSYSSVDSESWESQTVSVSSNGAGGRD
jgi:succinoglycan biosynthesis transport protein ExoP